MIRIIGDRLSWEIKAALLHTIGLLIAKAGPGLKPFVPQLQTTFLKCLGDQVCTLQFTFSFKPLLSDLDSPLLFEEKGSS